MMNDNQLGYRPLPWHKNILKIIKAKLYDFRTNLRFPWKKLITLLMILLVALAIYILVLINQVTVLPRAPYDKTGFIEASDYIAANGNMTIVENSNYKLTFDNKKTTFVLFDKQTLESWQSNPSTTSTRFLDALVVYYAGPLGAPTSMGVYRDAVEYSDYAIRLTDDAIEVIYYIGGKKGVDATDFPSVMTDERMQEKILSKLEVGSISYRRVAEQAYGSADMLDGTKIWTLKDGIQTSILNNLYKIFYEECGYTTEDLVYDLQINNISYDYDRYPYFEVSIKYTLNDDGFDIKLINDSIVEKAKFPLVYIDVLPYFSAATIHDSGYTLVPDGSGTLIDFNNNRSFAVAYNQRIYGKELAIIRPEMEYDREMLSLNLYGMKRNDFGFIAIAEEGAEMAALIANVSTVDNPYNQAYFRYFIRERELFKFETNTSTTNIVQWTTFYATSDLSIKIIYVNEDLGSYNGMAKAYQQYLVDNEILVKKDFTNSVTIDLTLLGGYLVKDNFIGIPYQVTRSLTNTHQVKSIVDELLSDGVTNLNVIYKGWSNDGLKPSYMGRINYNKATGNKKDLIALEAYLKSVDVNLFLEVLVNTAYTDKQFNQNEDAIRNVFGKVVTNYGYNEAILYSDRRTLNYYSLKPTTYDRTLVNIANHFQNSNISNIAFGDYGQQMYGSYHKKDTFFKSDTLDLFQKANDNYLHQFNRVLFRNPSLYALKYTDIATDIPTYGTDYQIVGQSVPFYQLVLSGFIDYSSKSFNIDDKYTYNWHKMKAIETLSNISLTWSYESTLALVETQYSYYYSTYYKNWYDRVLETYQELNNLGIYNTYLTKHEIIKPDGTITKSTYANNVEIVFNYSDSNYNYLGTNIAANSYVVIKEAN